MEGHQFLVVHLGYFTGYVIELTNVQSICCHYGQNCWRLYCYRLREWNANGVSSAFVGTQSATLQRAAFACSYFEFLVVLTTVLDCCFGSGSGSEPNCRRLCGPGGGFSRTINSDMVRWLSPNPS